MRQVLIEPVLGEGGYVVPPAGFLRDLREWCTARNVLLIADEVQCGFVRATAFEPELGDAAVGNGM